VVTKTSISFSFKYFFKYFVDGFTQKIRASGTKKFPLIKIENLDNINILARKAMYFSYLGFHVGKWDAEKNEVVTDPNSKMYDINLRKAMAYAIDNDAIGEQFYHGLATTAKSQLSPLFPSLHNPEINGFKQDVEKAKKCRLFYIIQTIFTIF